MNVHGSNPLWADPDDDSDGWYWFQDCQDDDSERAPYQPEALDGKDNDCDDIIDEDYYDLDSDSDGLYDYDEYHNIATDPNLFDSDGDGLGDGHEIMTTKSDPLTYDFDRDEDGFYAFEDCQDLVETINPDADEIWNGWDDDCNDIIDDENAINRELIIGSNPARSGLGHWDAVNRSFAVNLNGIPLEISKDIIWEMEGVNLSDYVTNDGQRLWLEIIDCESRDLELEKILCEQGDGMRYLNATIIDSGVETKLQWIIGVEVYVEPPTFTESLISFFGSSVGIIIILILIITIVGGVAFGAFRINQNKRIADAYREFKINLRPKGDTPEHRSVELPSAPDLGYLSLYQNEEDEPILVTASAVTKSSDDPPLLVTATAVSKSLDEEE